MMERVKMVIDCGTGEQFLVPLTKQEIAQQERDAKESVEREQENEQRLRDHLADLEALRNGTADQITRDRVLLRVFGTDSQ